MEKVYVPNDSANGAPGRLEVVRAFLNTVDLEAEARGERTERLGSWLREGPIGLHIDEEALEHLRGFREALRQAAEANAGDLPVGDAWFGLQRYAGEAGLKMMALPEGTLRVVASGKGAPRAIGEILAIVHEALLEGTWPRLKACRKSSCRWAFFDRSKNASGAWCDMAVCGNRVKAQRRRARQKSSSKFA